MADILDSIDTALLRATITKAHISSLYDQLESTVEPLIPTESMVELLRLNQRSVRLKSEIDSLTRSNAKAADEVQKAKLQAGELIPSEAVPLSQLWEEQRERRGTLKRSWYRVIFESEEPAKAIAEVFATTLESEADTLEAAIEALIEAWPIEASAGSAPTILRLCATLVREAALGTYVAPAERLFWLDLSDFEDLLVPA